jgi:hypothetical protein
MIRPLIAFAFVSTLVPASLAAQDAPPPVVAVQLTLEQRMLLRCSAAFALVANRQGSGEAWAMAYPPLGEHGREFFVVSSARLIDETGLNTAQLEPLMRQEAEALLDRALLQGVMPACLSLLPPEQQD